MTLLSGTTKEIDLEALRAALSKVSARRFETGLSASWNAPIASLVVELEARRARDAEVAALVAAASTLKVCGDGRGYFESGDDCNRFRAALAPFTGAKP